MTNLSHLPPGPKTGAFWQLLKYSQSPLPFLEDCSRQYGDPFTIRLARYGSLVMFSSPDDVREIFRGDARRLHSGEGNEFLSLTVGENSVLVLDEERHARQRRVLLPALKGERMRAFFEPLQSATLDTLRGWPRDRPIRLLDSMQHITLRVISQAVLGLSAGDDLDRFERQVMRVLSYGRSRYTLVLVKYLPIRQLQKATWMPYFRQVKQLDDSILARMESLRRQSPADRGASVLADLLAMTHEDGQRTTDQEIRDAVVTILMAGHDTTAIALAWALEQIAPRADVVGGIVDELTRVTGGGPPGPDHLDQLHYLEAAIRESLRVRTIIPFVVRLTKEPFVVGQREYPPGVLLSPCSHLVHRREDLYPQPERFMPERFLDRKYGAHEWFPFGGGNRMCLGMAFALYEMKVVLATLFSQLSLRRPAGAGSRVVRRGISLAPHDGVRMLVRDRTAGRASAGETVVGRSG